MAIATHTMEAEAKERQQRLVGHPLRRLRITCQSLATPVLVKYRLQSDSLRREPAEFAFGLLCEVRAGILRGKERLVKAL
jgi:hypothetical protein